MGWVSRLSFLAGFCLLARPAQAQFQQAWLQTALTNVNCEPVAVAIDRASGRFAIVSGLFGTGIGTAFFDRGGTLLWERRYRATTNSTEHPWGVAVDHAGNVLVTGHSYGESGPSDFVTVKYGPDGSQLWVARYDGPDHQWEVPKALVVDTGGNVYVTGSSGGVTGPDYATIKYSPDGVQLWAARYNGPADTDDTALALTVDPAGNVYVTGDSVGYGTRADYATIKYDSNGNQLWVARFDGPDHEQDRPQAIALDGSGQVYVTGGSWRKPQSYLRPFDYALVKYDANGNQLWVARYFGPDGLSRDTQKLALDNSGNVYIAGSVGTDIGVLKFDAAGNLLWVARQTLRDETYDLLTGLDLDSSGNAYVTGFADEASSSLRSIVTVKIDSAGYRRSLAVRPGDEIFDFPIDLKLDNDGGVYLGGYRLGGHPGAVALKYTQTVLTGLPAITTAPQSQAVPGGGSMTFTVAAAGSEPLSYQWRYNGRTIADATNSTLTLSNIVFAQRGDYSVVITNSVGSTVSPEAHLEVLVPPTIIEEPQDQYAFLGTEARFAVQADGTKPLSFQWRRDGTPLASATNDSLMITNVQQGDAGGYDLIVGNSSGAVTSAVARLTIFSRVRQRWARQIAIPGNEYAPLLKVDAAGNAYVAATMSTPYSDSDFLTMKCDPLGNVLWTNRFNNPSNTQDTVTAFTIDPQGNLYVGGLSDGRFTTHKYDTTGTLLWQAHYSGSSNGDETPLAIAVDQSGGVYVAGGSGAKITTLKFDTGGQQLWSVVHDRGGIVENFSVALALDAEGNAYIASAVRNENSDDDLIVLKYDPNGTQLWSANLDGGRLDVAVAIALDPYGGVVVSGSAVRERYEWDSSSWDFFTAKLAASDGDLLWSAHYDGINHTEDYASAMAVDGSGNVYVTGQNVLVKYDPTGQQLWVATADNSEYGGSRDLVLDQTGNVYLSVSLYRPETDTVIATSKYDSEGNRVWQILYRPLDAQADFAGGLGLDAAGNVYVAGSSSMQEAGTDLVIVKYQQAQIPEAPTIVAPPQNQIVGFDRTAIFTVTATPEGLHYQWRFNGNNIVGATSNSLVIEHVSYSDLGAYSVEVSNAFGITISRDAVLALMELPTITRQPQSQFVIAGSTALFAVEASGQGFLTYQWRHDGAPIPGATEPSLVFANAQLGNAGLYSVEVGNEAGAIFSAEAQLVVSLVATQAWVATYDGPAQEHDGATAMTVDGAGNVYVTGTSYLTLSNRNYATVKYDRHGQQLWVARYRGPKDQDQPRAIAVDQAGNVYVTGFSSGTGFDVDYATVKYDAAGNELWARRYNGPENEGDYAYALAVDASGNVYVTGESFNTNSPIRTSDYATVKYDPNGDQLWVARYNGPGNDYDSATAIAIDPTGNVIVTGYSRDLARQADFTTLKYDSAGNQLWEARLDDGIALALAVDANGSSYVTGSGFVTVKYDTNGHAVWVARPLGPENEGRVGVARALKLDAAGNIYLTGEVDSYSNYPGASYDFLTVKLDPAGQQLWATRYNGSAGGGDDRPVALALDMAGNAYVTGDSIGEDYIHGYTTIKYDAAGNQRWVARYQPGEPRAIAVDPFGNVFVTGSARGPGGSSDFVTIKYAQQDVAGAPVIVNGPQSRSVLAGTQVIYTANVSGAEPLYFQWQLNGRDLPGERAPTFTISSADPSHIGGIL